MHDYLNRFRRRLAELAAPDDGLCVVAFEGEANEAAMATISHMAGWHATAYLQGVPVSVEIGPLARGRRGNWVVILYPFDGETGEVDRKQPVAADIYDELERLVVT